MNTQTQQLDERVAPDEEPLLQLNSSDNFPVQNYDVINPTYPRITDEDGCTAQEFFVEFNGTMYKYDPTTESVDDALARLQSHDTLEPEPLEEHIITPPSSTHTKHVHNRKRKRKTRSKRRHTLSEDTVINLSNIQLSNAEMKLLSRGLTFVPTPQRIQWSEVQADMNDFARRLRLK